MEERRKPRSFAGARTAPGGEKKERSFSKSGERKPYNREERGGERRPYNRDERPERKPYNSDNRTERRPFNRDERSERKPYSSDNRGERRPFNRDERPERRPYNSENRSERRPFNRDERPERKPYNSDNRTERRPFNRDERPERKPYNSDNRTERRPFNRDERPERKPYNSDNRTERRPFNRDERPERKPYGSDNRGERRPYNRDERPERKPYNSDNRSERRPFNRDERPERKPYNSDNRSERRPFNREERPEKKPYNREERPERSFSRSAESKPFERRERKFENDETPKPRKRRDVTAESEILSEIVDLRKSEGRQAPRKQKILTLEYEEKYGPIRLNKYISNSGICSRRDADMLIQTGAITVNGNIVTELGIKVMPTDEVRYGDKILQREKPVYILLNKPKDYITTTDDERDRKNVMELIKGACKERVYPVGRLDKNTTGLLLFTNDGEMTKKLTHPKHNIRKIYSLELDRNLTSADFDAIVNGIELDDGVIKVDEIAYVGDTKRELGITLHSGKNRIVRRIFEELGYEVMRLDRVVFAGLTKKDLPRGEYRFLSQAEINILRMINNQ